MTAKRFVFVTRPFRFLIFLFFAGIAAATVGFVVMWLWNAILPDLVDARKISYWQSVGLLVLCRILFGSFHRGGGQRKQWGLPPHLKAKFMNMTEEEKLAFKEEMKRRCASR